LFIAAQLWITDKIAKTIVGLTGLILIIAGIVVAVSFGATAIDTRERPFVTLQVAAPAAPTAGSAESPSSTLEVTVSARATSLTTNDELLVQVIGLLPEPQDLASIRPPSGAPSPASPSEAIPWKVVDICETNHTYVHGTDLNKNDAKLLVWNRFGPKPDGSVDATFKIQIPAGTYSYVCAWAPLGNYLNPHDEGKNSAAYLRLK
jgi:hypothetical protein